MSFTSVRALFGRALLVLVVALAGVGGIGTTPAFSYKTINGDYLFENHQVRGWCLDGGSSVTAYPDASLATCSDYLSCCANPSTPPPNLRWTYNPSVSEFQLKNVGNGLCLDGGGNSGDIYLRACHDNPNLRWRFLHDPHSSRFQLQNVATNLCVDGGGSPGAKVYPRDCNWGNANLSWA